MRLTMKERKKATAVMAARYQKARKKDKGVILDEFTKLTGYGRRYASHVLRCHGRKTRITEWIKTYKEITKQVDLISGACVEHITEMKKTKGKRNSKEAPEILR